METLMELTDDYLALLEYADATDDADEQIFIDTLEEVKAHIGAKADNYAAVLAEIDGKITTFKAEIDRLQRRVNAMENSKKNMKNVLKIAMEQMGTQEIKGKFHRFKIVKNGGLAPMKITAPVPDNYCKVILEPDNNKIRKALENGEELSFAHIEERGTHVKID